MLVINNLETLKKAMKNSSAFENMINEWVYDDMMEQQRWLLDDLGGLKGCRYHDNYTSFFYTITDRKAFLEGLEGRGLWCSEEAEKLAEKESIFQNMDYENKQADNLDAWLDKKAAALLADIEESLHFYENPDQAAIDETLENFIDSGLLENYFLDGKQVKQMIPARAAQFLTV